MRNSIVKSAGWVLLGIFISIQACTSAKSGAQQDKNSLVLTFPEYKLRLQAISDDIVRITATDAKEFDETPSLMRDPEWKSDVSVTVSDSGGLSTFSTASTKIQIDKKSGQLSFYDAEGNLKIAESGNGRMWGIKESDGWKKVGQVFESPDDEALYGLGQHQHGYMNYKGKDVDLTQHNIVAVVPFLYSSRNYGILWDNYSITRFGDPRPFEQISGLQLKDENGKTGGLTEVWFKKDVEVSRKQVSSIDYQYLETPSYEMLPKSSEVDKIVFSGKISSQQAGKHKFLLYASNYFKLWIDGRLIFDKWRQNWNPWSNPFEVMMNAGEEHDIKIEWIPNGGYLSLTHLDPWNDTEQNQIRFTSDAGKQIDYYFVNGKNADEVIGGYRKLTGKSSLLPKSAYGFWQSRERYKTQDEILETAKAFREKEIPLDNLVLDWSYWPEDAWGSHEFDTTRFADAAGMNQSLSDQDIDIMISVWPKYYEGIPHYEEMKAQGYLFLNNIEKKRLDWIGKGYHNTFYDPFNAGARKMFWEQLDEHLFSKGFDRYWLDATEPDMHSNLSIEARIENMAQTAIGPGRSYFNAYSLMNSRGVYEGQHASHPDERVFILTRSAFAGQQRFGSVTWSGDIVSRWSDLSDQVAAGINFSLSGIPNWTMDIGGFAVEDRFAKDGQRQGVNLEDWRELNTRWFQFGAFCPLFRSHGQYPYREVYNIAPESHPAYQSMLYYNRLRYRLMPYIYSLAASTFYDDNTMMRGLIMDFGHDAAVYNISDQYMFGKDIMVCPITGPGVVERMVYFPKGQVWYDFYSGKVYEGGQSISVPAPYGKMPLFVKAGAVVPFGPAIQSTKTADLKNLDIYVYEGADGMTKLYDDGGKDMSFQQGNFTSMEVSYLSAEGKLSLGKRSGQFLKDGEVQLINIYVVNPDRPFGFDSDKKGLNVHTITYAGEPMEIQL